MNFRAPDALTSMFGWTLSSARRDTVAGGFLCAQTKRNLAPLFTYGRYVVLLEDGGIEPLLNLLRAQPNMMMRLMIVLLRYQPA